MFKLEQKSVFTKPLGDGRVPSKHVQARGGFPVGVGIVSSARKLRRRPTRSSAGTAAAGYRQQHDRNTAQSPHVFFFGQKGRTLGARVLPLQCSSSALCLRNNTVGMQRWRRAVRADRRECKNFDVFRRKLIDGFFFPRREFFVELWSSVNSICTPF